MSHKTSCTFQHLWKAECICCCSMAMTEIDPHLNLLLCKSNSSKNCLTINITNYLQKIKTQTHYASFPSDFICITGLTVLNLEDKINICAKERNPGI